MAESWFCLYCTDGRDKRNRKKASVYGLLHQQYLLFTSGTTSKMDGYRQSVLKITPQHVVKPHEGF